MIQSLSIVLVTAMLAGLLSIVLMSFKNGISPMPTSAVVRRTVSAVVRQLPRRDVIVEAGSGWGHLAVHLSQQCPGSRIVGIENSIVPYWCSRIAGAVYAFMGNKQGAPKHASLTFERTDLYAYTYDEVDIIVCYLYPGAMKRLAELADSRLAPGTKIVSACFALPGRQPDRVIPCKDLFQTKVYVYTL